MTHRVVGMVVMVALLAGATPGWSQQYYLYVPRPVAAEEKVQKKDGILVKEVEVRKGDTLYGISRRFSGRGSYYPQILLFNDIKNPNLIYTGHVLKIPVSRSAATERTVKPHLQSRAPLVPSVEPAAAVPAGDVNKGVAEDKKRDLKQKAAAPAGTQAKATEPPATPAAASSEQMLFERAIKAYQQDDIRTAVELFDRFLAEYPSSALAADASLYKAECYLKQSRQ
jgi:LysM repeat protein